MEGLCISSEKSSSYLKWLMGYKLGIIPEFRNLFCRNIISLLDLKLSFILNKIRHSSYKNSIKISFQLAKSKFNLKFHITTKGGNWNLIISFGWSASDHENDILYVVEDILFWKCCLG